MGQATADIAHTMRAVGLNKTENVHAPRLRRHVYLATTLSAFILACTWHSDVTGGGVYHSMGRGVAPESLGLCP